MRVGKVLLSVLRKLKVSPSIADLYQGLLELAGIGSEKIR